MYFHKLRISCGGSARLVPATSRFEKLQVPRRIIYAGGARSWPSSVDKVVSQLFANYVCRASTLHVRPRLNSATVMKVEVRRRPRAVQPTDRSSFPRSRRYRFPPLTRHFAISMRIKELTCTFLTATDRTANCRGR